MKTRYAHIYFEVIDIKPKTKVWVCRNNKSGGELGEIKWYPPWRRYCYFPIAEIVFDTSCLKDVIDFIESLQSLFPWERSDGDK